MRNPLVSVIMPVYNEAQHIDSAIKSILCQTFNDFELIIIDDGSTDGTLDKLKEYRKKDRRIVLINNRIHRGIVHSLNMGLARAKGKYIARMDANDVSLPYRLEKQLLHMKQHPNIGVLGTNMLYIDLKGRLLFDGRPKDVKPLSPRIIHWLLYWRTAIYHTTVMIRKSILEKNRIKYEEEFCYAEDRDLWTKLAKVTLIDSLYEPLVFCRLIPNSISCAFKSHQRLKNYLITRREVISTCGNDVSYSAVETLASIFSKWKLPQNKDFVKAADLLIVLFRRYCVSPILGNEFRHIGLDVILRLIKIAELASIHSLLGTLVIISKIRFVPFGCFLQPDCLKSLGQLVLKLIKTRITSHFRKVEM